MIFTNFKHASVLPEKFEGLMQFGSLCMSITMIIYMNISLGLDST